MVCLNVGTTNIDISGLGILISFGVQAGISIILSIVSFVLRDAATSRQRQVLRDGFKKKHVKERWVYNHVVFAALKDPKAFISERFLAPKPPAEDESEDVLEEDEKRRRAKRRIIDRVLAGASDVQTLNGIALLIAALIQWKALDLYHFHIVYDTASFVGVSFVAALTNVFGYGDERRTSRYICIVVFGILFLVFTIIFGISLNKWDESVPGRCYNAKGIAAPGSKHPLGDSVYVGITCFYLMVTLGSAIKYSIGDTKKHVFRRFGIIQLSAIQYPIHLYMIITMRESNANLLEGSSENEWGFAQIVALVLLGSTLIECVRGGRDIWLISRTSRAENDLEQGDEGRSSLRRKSTGSAGRSATRDANTISSHPSNIVKTA